MNRIQSKLLLLSATALLFLAVFAGLVIWRDWSDYRSLAGFRRTNDVAAAAYELTRQLTDERQAAYYASAFLGEGSPAQQLAVYREKITGSTAAMDRLRKLANDPALAASARFRAAIDGALAVETELAALRRDILDPARPQVQELDSKLKTRALAVFDAALGAQAVVLPTLATEASEPHLVRLIATQDNVARLQKDLWKVRGLVATALRTDKLTDVSATELKLKLQSVDEHSARIRSLADGAIAANLDAVLQGTDGRAVLSLAGQLRDLGAKASGFRALGTLAEYQNGPSARLERSFLAFADQVNASGAAYTTERLARAQRALWVWTIACGLAVVALCVVMLAITRSITRPLRGVGRQLEETGAQVREAARTFADSARQLSADAGVQAENLREITQGTRQLTAGAEKNLAQMEQLAGLAQESGAAVEEGTRHLAELHRAVSTIQRSTGEVAGILKTIDEIAFQTNVLALNAAVEAARAGEAGAGFSIVAEEVRTLAQRSAQAARDTAAKIESAVASSAQGAQLAERTENRFREIERITAGHREIVEEVARESRASVEHVAALGRALTQLDETARRAASMAQESSSAASTMQAQTEDMAQATHELDRMVNSQTAAVAPVVAAALTPVAGRREKVAVAPASRVVARTAVR